MADKTRLLVLSFIVMVASILITFLPTTATAKPIIIPVPIPIVVVEQKGGGSNGGNIQIQAQSQQQQQAQVQMATTSKDQFDHGAVGRCCGLGLHRAGRHAQGQGSERQRKATQALWGRKYEVHRFFR